MKGKLFWEKRTLKKFRIIFESADIVVGADRKNKYRTFRKDTGLIAFSRREVLEMRFGALTKKQKSEKSKDEKITNLDNSALNFNFG